MIAIISIINAINIIYINQGTLWEIFSDPINHIDKLIVSIGIAFAISIYFTAYSFSKAFI
jgi:hypothetical protein